MMAATSSSTVGGMAGFQIFYTDADDSVSYGTTAQGGAFNDCGTIFKITPTSAVARSQRSGKVIEGERVVGVTSCARDMTFRHQGVTVIVTVAL
jgi:uncharacterized repeat protein (TIGR03803 family)